ncbi:helix-turn-helix transcriptional regulator [Bradyrhizobium sp. Arg68]|uniref:helix-turn-helix domain-containing protein n=1 Tax=Bradyrhizobium ivorense TaxID=2511166 RepID=UPI0027E2C92B|nr:AraC family transcriptional regulator [Bradyrhizobium ivorense]MCC8935666.1 helix-turn-helix transcriptional regulator [Bradyrhizobium ivorense]
MNAPIAAMLRSAPLPADDASRDAVAMAGAVAKLLRSGLKVLETDRKSAVEIFARACAILEVAAAAEEACDSTSLPTVAGGLTARQIHRVKTYVDDNLGGNVSVTELADIVDLGPSHFRRAFKKSLGVSPHAFVVEHRVRRAQQLMLGTDHPLSEIALQVGFADQAHLTTRFHRVVGKTPGAWRRERDS